MSMLLSLSFFRRGVVNFHEISNLINKILNIRENVFKLLYR